MMKFTFKNPLEVNENDMFGTAVLKKLTNGYVKGTLAAGIGLGVLAIGSKLISNKIESEREKEEQEIEEMLEEILKQDAETLEKMKIDEDGNVVEVGKIV